MKHKDLEFAFIESRNWAEIVSWVLENYSEEFLEEHADEWAAFLKMKKAREWCVFKKFELHAVDYITCERCKSVSHTDATSRRWTEMESFIDDFCKAHMDCTPEMKIIGRVREVSKWSVMK